MEELRVEDYQNSNHEYRRYLTSENEEMPLYQKAGLGAVAAVGALAIGHRSGAMRQLSRFLNREVSASRQAFRETMNEEGSFAKNFSLDRLKKSRDTYQNKKEDLLSLKDKQEKSLLSSREFDMTRYLRQRQQLIENDVPEYMSEGLRLQSVMQEVRKSNNITKDTADQIERGIGRGYNGVLRKGSNSDIRHLLNQEGIQDKGVIDLVNDIRLKNKSKDFSKTSQQGKEWIEGIQEKLRAATSKDIESITKANGTIKQTIIGSNLKQATIQDVLDLHKSQKAILPEDVKSQIDSVLGYNKDFKDAIFDNNLYVNLKDGKATGLTDYKPLDQVKRDAMEWWSHTLPGGLMHLRDIINIRSAREQSSFRIFKRGTVQPMLNGHLGLKANEPLTEDVIFSNGKFMRLFDHQAITSNKPLEVLNPERDMYLTSARFGTISTISRQMSGTMTDGSRSIMGMDASNSKLAKLLDIGGQEKDPIAVEGFSVFSKFWDKDWDRRKINKALQHGIDSPSQYHDMQRFLDQNSKGLSSRVFNEIKSDLPTSLLNKINEMNINFSRDDDMIRLFKHLGQDENIDTSFAFNQLYRNFERNPDEVLGKTIPHGQTSMIMGGTIQIKTGMDEINQEVGKELIRQITEVKPNGLLRSKEVQHQLRKKLKDSQKSGAILKKDLQEAEWLINQQMFEQAGRHVNGNYERIFEDVNGLLLENDDASKSFQSSLSQMAKKINPLLHKNTNAQHTNQIANEYIAVNKANIFKNLGSGEGIADLLKQSSFRTGRRNPEDVTTLSIFGSYYPVYRIQEALGSLGLGLSDASMGSPLQIWSSLLLKRGLPIVGAAEGYQYTDYLLDKHTGAGIEERWENYKANQRIEDAELRETFGSTDELRRERMLKPGIEHFEAMPEIHIPGIGEVGPGHLLNGLTGAAPLSEEDTMTVEETYDDLLHGTEEIRKGRWWAIGSRTAYRGDRIIEFAPNSYRKAHSDWEYSEVTSSAEEKYAHSLFPTFENPLGALSFLIGTRDPYWWEKKHYYDRPYMLTGDLFNSNTPFLGDIGNMTIGQLIKPTREMHKEYWGDPEVVQEEFDLLGERPVEPVTTRISPSGRIEYNVDASPEDYGARSSYYIARRRYDEDSDPTGDMIIGDPTTGKTIYLPRRLNDKYVDLNSAFIAAEQNDQRSVETEPRGMFAPSYEYQQQVDKNKINELQDPRSFEWRGQELASNWLEPHGVYNWIFMDEILGRDPYVGKTVVAKSDEAYNASDAFWESELGSLGGSLSEIGRRFIRRDSGQLDKYNPIPNTMPDWLPGGNYFINFQTGDPYSLIPHGEYRLPGEAYEKLNRLHPDETGTYGAFDKFKILADVAPWSDEYKFWKDYVTEYVEDDQLRKQAAQIKRQVSRRKQKYEFQEYLYKDAELEKEKVTVTRFLDDYTFLTEEYGDQPIRLAGVDSRANAEGVLEEYIDVGDRITIGIDADENKRISSDTYGTMRAVVFQGINSLNKQIIDAGQMKELESDFSSPGVWARFSPEEIAKGSRWESIAHFDSALNTKFLQVRTALEEYERDQIYGQDWSTWENFGITDYGIPAIHKMAGKDNPLLAGLSGAMFGGVVGRIFLGGGNRTKAGAIIGGITGLTANAFAKLYQYRNDERWIPERRRTEQDINEYFDILKYMKYAGLYEKAKEELDHLGYDADEFLRNVEEKEQRTKEARRELEEQKKQLYIEQPRNWEEKKKKINIELKKIEEQWDEIQLPTPVAQALYYKEQRDTTLYGIDPHEDRMKVMQSLPYKDKWFFNEFVDANAADRKKILELVPENQRRIYKTIWGMEAEEKKPLSYYANKYAIPDADWEGWSPEYSLDDIKVKTVMEEGIDLTDFNYWNDDIEAAALTPDLPNDYNEPEFLGYQSVEKNLRDVLQGQGLHNVQVIVKPSNGNETHTRINYQQDRSKEIEDEFRYNMDAYL
ncbi:glycine zipper 2TM domain-containing protein [Virgibacillus salexigens]|uniref:Uncharacterized protein n=1 Tax=Virgibacillus massiliensis TaxID=1462526 RepID=A0A024QGX1_9BACI|nr:hypothetical protein [Virgibacillus massiliensis]CDQ41808.1 hypothetical protein BN990_04185 [Virgibacillus massiliensis]